MRSPPRKRGACFCSLRCIVSRAKLRFMRASFETHRLQRHCSRVCSDASWPRPTRFASRTDTMRVTGLLQQTRTTSPVLTLKLQNCQQPAGSLSSGYIPLAPQDILLYDDWRLSKSRRRENLCAVSQPAAASMYRSESAALLAFWQQKSCQARVRHHQRRDCPGASCACSKACRADGHAMCRHGWCATGNEDHSEASLIVCARTDWHFLPILYSAHTVDPYHTP
jgi:hypothetical protein